jgi:SAM-dependent methyltransferase
MSELPATDLAGATRATFDEDAYLALHPDVAAALESGIVGSGWQHFQLHGAREGRRWVRQPDRMDGVRAEIAPGDEMFAGNPEHYFDVGHGALRAITAALGDAGWPEAHVRRVLDLPCGHGRVLRFLRARYPQAAITACDLNRDGVEFCARTFGAEPVPSHVDPTQLRLGGNYDLIWCGSLLTHLPRAGCEAFLRLFAAQLAPGGVLVLTLHGRHYAETLGDGRRTGDLDAARIETLLAQHARAGFGYVDYDGHSGYGFSLTAREFVLANWVPLAGWRVVSYRERGWDRRQDVLSLQRV